MTKVRLRFAPSPTGPLHIGGARSALFNYLLVAKLGGEFILRIENTDLDRSTPESEENIKDSLRWLGITWNEGVDVGGAKGPYRQMERLAIYQESAAKLVAEGKAYPCYCSEEELAATRASQQESGQTPHYNGRCRNLSAEQIAEFEAKGVKPTMRFAVPNNQDLIIDDLVRGQVVFNSDQIGGDFVIMKSDSIPTYNFAAVVDDYLMEISHVIRAEEHLSNTPRQLLLYDAFDYARPTFAHVSLILGPDHSKMSKRHGSVSVVNYRDQGFLPAAINNFLVLLGWSPKGETEILSMDEMIAQFSLEHVSKSPAVFDINKLRWINSQYLRALPIEEIADGLSPFVAASYDQEQKLLLAETMINHLETYADIKQFLPLIEGDADLPTEGEAADLLKQEHVPQLIEVFSRQCSELEQFSPAAIKGAIKATGKEINAKGAALFMCLRIAITGQMHGPDIDKLAALMGKELLLKRLDKALKSLK